jgi:DNA-binding transcriptional LysR family regulator
VRLTPAAEVLVEHANGILTILEQAETDLASSISQVRGTLRLAAFTTISRNVVPQVISSLGRDHPDLDVRFRQVEPEQGLLLLSSRRLDVLVADSYPGTSQAVPDDLHADLLMDDPVRAYPPVGADAGTLDGLRRLRWVIEPSGAEAHAWVRRVCREHGFEPDVAYESADLLFHLRLVQSGVAAAFLPDLLVRGEGATLTPSAVLGTQQRRQIWLICRAGAERRPAVRACRDAFSLHLESQVSAQGST